MALKTDGKDSKGLVGVSIPRDLKAIRILLGVFLFSGSLFGYGQEAITLVPKDSLKLKSSITHLDLSHITYISSDELFFKSRNASETLSTIGLSLEDKISLRDPCSSTVNGTAFYSIGESRAYVNPRWAYIGCSIGDSVMELGRVPHNWSFSDQFWLQGYQTPRFMWDRSRPINQGLTGIYIHRSISDHWSVTGFLTPFYVPDFGTSVDEEDGRIVSNNPWFRPPPKEMQLFGKTLPVRAKVNAPDAEDVVRHGGVGGQIRWMYRESYVQAGVLYKPMNQFLLSTPVHLQDSTYVEIDITPTVRYHTVSWMEWGRDRWGVDKAFITLTLDDPESADVREGWILQDVKPATNLSLYYGRDWKGAGKEATHIYGAYYRLLGGVSKDIGEFASSTSYFESRYILRNAVRLGVQQPIYGRWWNKDWQSDVAVTYDITLGGAMFTSQVDLNWTENLKFSFIGDLIGIINDNGADEISNFFADYRTNDKIQLRMSYVY
ncbi:MAG: hypothetical protein KDD61_08180 [Bdellovibrionales bacterium]|nr:hypothetical protein [Bdellovibrionales bacterium]